MAEREMEQPAVVWKFELRPWTIYLDVPRGAQLLHAGAQGQRGYVWALCDPDAEKVARMVFAHPTGPPLPPAGREASYVGTFTISDPDGGPPLVFHVFDGGEQ